MPTIKRKTNNNNSKKHRSSKQVQVKKQEAAIKSRQKSIDAFQKKEHTLMQRFNATKEQLTGKIEERITTLSQELDTINTHITALNNNKQQLESMLQNPVSKFYAVENMENHLTDVKQKIAFIGSQAKEKNQALISLQKTYNEYTKQKIDFMPIDDTQFIVKDLLGDTGMFPEIDNPDFFTNLAPAVNRELGPSPVLEAESEAKSIPESEQNLKQPAK